MRIKPDWSKGYYRLGHTLALLHRYEEAQTALKKGLQIEPSNTDISSRLKEVEATLKKESAKRAKANTANMTPFMAAKEEGNTLYKDGKFPEATVRQPDLKVGLVPRSLSCLQAVYTRALSLASTPEEKVALLNNRAACRFQDRDFRQCVSDCSEALALDPNNVKALLRRGQSYENIEKIELAMADMKRLQELSPGLPQVSQAIHRLTRMAKQKEGHTW